MPHIEAECKALLLYRMYLQGQLNGTVTAAWLQPGTSLHAGKPTACHKVPH